MTRTNEARTEAAAEIYLIFSEMFKLPAASFVQQLKHGEVDEVLAALFKQADYGQYPLQLQHDVDDYEAFKSAYIHAFSGIYKPFALPVESVYKPWTNDKDANVPMVNQPGYLYGDPALHMKHLFQTFNLEIPAEYQGVPDHLTLLLEFLAFLLQEGEASMVAEFIHDHLDWLPDFLSKMKEIEVAPIYIEVVELMIHALNKEEKIMKAKA